MSKAKPFPAGPREKLPDIPWEVLSAAGLALLDAIEPLRDKFAPDVLATAAVALAKVELRTAPGYGPSRGAITLRLAANRLEQEKALPSGEAE